MPQNDSDHPMLSTPLVVPDHLNLIVVVALSSASTLAKNVPSKHLRLELLSPV